MKQFKMNRFFIVLLMLMLYLVTMVMMYQMLSLELVDYAVVTVIALLGLITIFTGPILGLFLAFVVTFMYGVLVIVSGTTDLIEPVGISYYYLIAPGVIAMLTGFMNMFNKNHLILSRDFEEQYQELVRIDELTGFRNGIDYMANLQEEMNRANRYHHDLTVMMIHIESFDTLSHLYGLAQGERFLKYLSEFIVELTRNVDKHYRIEHDLFALILPDTTAQGAMILKERFISELESLNIVIKSSHQELAIEIDIVYEHYTDKLLDARGFHEAVTKQLVLEPRGVL